MRPGVGLGDGQVPQQQGHLVDGEAQQREEDEEVIERGGLGHLLRRVPQHHMRDLVPELGFGGVCVGIWDDGSGDASFNKIKCGPHNYTWHTRH